MNVIVGRRSQGKTSMLIRMSADGQGTIVTATPWGAKHVKDLAKEMKLDIPDPICWSEFLKQKPGSHKPYLLDEAGMVLDQLGIKVATLDDSCVKWMGE